MRFPLSKSTAASITCLGTWRAMNERSAGVLSSSTAAAACQIASALAGGGEGARAQAASTSSLSKASETAVAHCLFSVSSSFSNLAGLLLAVGCLAGFLVAACAEVLYTCLESAARGALRLWSHGFVL